MTLNLAVALEGSAKAKLYKTALIKEETYGD